MGQIFVKASRRARAHIRRRSIKSLYKSYETARVAHFQKHEGDWAIQRNGRQNAVTLRFNKLWKAVSSNKRIKNPHQVIGGLSTGKYKLR